jgi:ribosomal protein S18 acetylase RimI-like enzyme
MPDIQIEVMRVEMQLEAATVLARAFLTNPLNVAAFGAGALARNEAFFRRSLTVMKGQKLVAVADARILGVIHWVESPACQFSGIEKLGMTPSMIAAVGLRSALRVSSWLSIWERHDPKKSHSHLGPLGVAPEAQGRHVGQRLMEYYCDQLDTSRRSGYLETDRSENITFYRRFGFEIVEQGSVLGIPNYFMCRPAKAS